MADNPPAADDKVVLDEEAKKLKLEETKAGSRKAIAEAQKAIAEANKSALVAQLPTSTTTPLEGKVEVGEKVGLIADLVAHALLENGASDIVGQFKDKLEGDKSETLDGDKSKTVRVLIVEDRLLATTDWQYGMVTQQIAAQQKALAEATAKVDQAAGVDKTSGPQRAAMFAPTAALTAATAITGSLATLVGMFRTDYAITHRDVTIGGAPLVASFAHALLALGQAVVVDGFELLVKNKVIKDFDDLAAKRSELEFAKGHLQSARVTEAQQLVDDLREEERALRAAYVKALGASDQATQISALRARLDEIRIDQTSAANALREPRAAVAFADKVLERFDAFTTAVTTTADGAKYPPLVAAALREPLHLDATAGEVADETRAAPITHVLYVGVESAAGETITRRGLFVRSGRVGFLGGVQVSFLLHDVAANVTIAAGTESLLGRMQYGLGAATWSDTTPKIERVAMTVQAGPGS